MKAIKNIGLIIFLTGLGVFAALPLVGKFEVSNDAFAKIVAEKGIKSEIFIQEMQTNVIGKELDGMQALSPKITQALQNANAHHRKNKEYKKVIYTKPHDMAALVGKKSGSGFIVNNKGLMWFLTFGLGIIGALLFIIPNVVLLGKKGIKNDGIYHENATNRGWIACWFLFFWSPFTSFYTFVQNMR